MLTEVEPLPADSLLWDMDNVILTQHTGGGHKNEHMGKVDLFLNNIFKQYKTAAQSPMK